MSNKERTETVEEKMKMQDAFDEYIKTKGSDYNRMYGHHFNSFKAGAEWQKNLSGSCEGWISCADKLPEMNTVVVGWHTAQLVPVICFYTNTGWCLDKSPFYTEGYDAIKIIDGKISHWMPVTKTPPQASSK